MFKLIGVVNKCLTSTITKATAIIDINLDSGLALSRTGNNYAKQFENDAMLQLKERRAMLVETTS